MLEQVNHPNTQFLQETKPFGRPASNQGTNRARNTLAPQSINIIVPQESEQGTIAQSKGGRTKAQNQQGIGLGLVMKATPDFATVNEQGRIHAENIIKNQLLDELDDFVSAREKELKPQKQESQNSIRNSSMNSLPGSPLQSDKLSESSEESDKDSEESFWEYLPCTDETSAVTGTTLPHETPIASQNVQHSVASLNSAAFNQSKKGKPRKNQAVISNQIEVKPAPISSDPFFGLNPSRLIVKDFPQNEDEESVFKWWDQIDDVYFPAKIRDGFIQYINIDFPLDFQQVIRNLDKCTDDKVTQTSVNFSAQQCSSAYYSQFKDSIDEIIPFKMQNYLSVVFCDNFVEPNEPKSGFLCVYKWKTFDKKIKGLTVNDEDVYNKTCGEVEVVSAVDFKRIKQWTKGIVSSEPQDLSEFEPALNKHRFLNSKADFMSINPVSSATNFDKRKATLKLKKVIALSQHGMQNSLQQTNFLNAFLGSRMKKESNMSTMMVQSESPQEHPQLFEVEKTEIENNIFSLEYLIFKLEIGSGLKQMRQEIEKNSKEMNYLELRNLSVRINDNLKWLTIRKNILLGFSDRLLYDSKNYFTYDSEEKTAINLAHSVIVEEKRAMEMLSLEDQHIATLRKIASSDHVLQLQKEQHQSRQELKLSLRKSHKQQQSQRKLSKTVIEEESEPEDDGEIEQLEEEIRIPEVAVVSISGEGQASSAGPQKTNKLGRKKKKPEVNATLLETDCSVCFHHVNNENNTVVYCSVCNASFHKHCYGIDFIPEERFLCRKCETRGQLVQQQKKRGLGGVAAKSLKDEVTQQFQCRLCTETQLPVITVEDHLTFYHPTCLFLFNYAIYNDSRLMLRDVVTDQTIAADVKRQSTITCEHCRSRRGLKVRCCYNSDSKSNSDEEISGCNYFIHPLCAFLSGMEIWAEERESDKEAEHEMMKSEFKKLTHLGIQVKFLCSNHAVKIDRDDQEQAYYRRFQINYGGICEFDTYESYKSKCELDQIKSQASWNGIIEAEQNYKQSFSDSTYIILNRKEIEESYRVYKEIALSNNNPGDQQQIPFSDGDDNEGIIEEENNEVEDYEEAEEDKKGQSNYKYQENNNYLDEDDQAGAGGAGVATADDDDFYGNNGDDAEDYSRVKSKKRVFGRSAASSIPKKIVFTMLGNLASVKVVDIISEEGDEGFDECDVEDEEDNYGSDQLGELDDMMMEDDDNSKSETEYSGNSGSSANRKSKGKGFQQLKRGRKSKFSHVAGFENKSNFDSLSGSSKIAAKNSKGKMNMSIFAPSRNKESSLTKNKVKESNPYEESIPSQDESGFAKSKRKYDLRKQQGKNYKASLIKEDTAFLTTISQAFIQSQIQLLKKYNQDSNISQDTHTVASEQPQKQPKRTATTNINNEVGGQVKSKGQTQVQIAAEEGLKQIDQIQQKEESFTSISSSVPSLSLAFQQQKVSGSSQLPSNQLDLSFQLPLLSTENEKGISKKSSLPSFEFPGEQVLQQQSLPVHPLPISAPLPKNKGIGQRRNKISSLTTPNQKKKNTKQQGGSGGGGHVQPRSAPDLEKEFEAAEARDLADGNNNTRGSVEAQDLLLDFDQFEEQEKILNPFSISNK